MRKVTIRDVAELAGVSTATVSRVINENGYVSAEAAQRVQSVMEELNWRPNTAAQRLRSRFSPIIGLILPNTLDPFFGSIADSLILHCAEAGLNVMPLVSHHADGYNEVEQFRRLKNASVDGIIYCSIEEPNLEALRYYCSGIPMVVCSRHDLVPGYPHVYFNHQKGGYLATKHLLDMGHRRIALLVGVFGDRFHSAEDLQQYLDNPVLAGPYSGVDKYIGARKALDDAGVPFYPELLDFIDLGNAYSSSYHAMQRVLARSADIDAIFCSNDWSANGVIQMLAQQRISVPEDISIIGYDDGPMSTCTQPQLTTVLQDTNLLGKECANCMTRLLTDGSAEDVVLDVRLVLRQSSCRRV